VDAPGGALFIMTLVALTTCFNTLFWLFFFLAANVSPKTKAYMGENDRLGIQLVFGVGLIVNLASLIIVVREIG
jgi:hypothetical protein